MGGSHRIPHPMYLSPPSVLARNAHQGGANQLPRITVVLPWFGRLGSIWSVVQSVAGGIGPRLWSRSHSHYGDSEEMLLQKTTAL